MNPALKANLGYRDAQAAIRFLTAAFGFEAVVVYSGPTSDAIGYAELRWPGGGIVTLHSAEPHRNSVASLTSQATRDGGYPAFSIHVDVDDPDALFAKAIAAGATVVQEVQVSPFGTRGFVVSDPEGLYWSFGTPLPKLVRDQDGRWQPDEKI
jgi:uncharacterized glyoxalase superfamily protein PhnB